MENVMNGGTPCCGECGGDMEIDEGDCEDYSRMIPQIRTIDEETA
jgi:hypothetical protein